MRRQEFESPWGYFLLGVDQLVDRLLWEQEALQVQVLSPRFFGEIKNV